MKPIFIYFVVFVLPVSATKEINWEFLGPDTTGLTSNITALYSFGNGYLIAGKGPDIQSSSVKTFMRSYDYGKTWDTVNAGLPNFYEVRRFLFYNGVLWAGLADLNYPSLYFSKDTGKTWNSAGEFPIYPFGRTYCMEAKDSIMVVGNYGTWGRSTDYGKTWQEYDPETLYKVKWNPVLSMLNYKDTLFIATYFGVWASYDWGLNWELREGGNGTLAVSLASIGDKILLGTSACALWFKNIKPSQGQFVLLNYYPSDTKPFVINKKDIYVYSTYGDSCATFSSKDTGKTWNRFYLRPNATNVYIHIFYNDEKYIYAGSTKGLYRKLLNDTQVTINNFDRKNATFSRFFFSNSIQLSFQKPVAIKLHVFSSNGSLVFSEITFTHTYYRKFNTTIP